MYINLYFKDGSLHCRKDQLINRFLTIKNLCEDINDVNEINLKEFTLNDFYLVELMYHAKISKLVDNQDHSLYNFLNPYYADDLEFNNKNWYVVVVDEYPTHKTFILYEDQFGHNYKKIPITFIVNK